MTEARNKYYDLLPDIVNDYMKEINLITGNKYDILANPEALKHYNLPMPKIVEFSYKALKDKGIKMGYRDDVNDLLKDIYRYAK